MKKVIPFLAILCSLSMNAQYQTPRVFWVFNDFQVAIGATNLLPNKSMLGDAHATGIALDMRLGVFHYRQLSLGVQSGWSNMRVNDNKYYGNFDNTRTLKIGPYVSYFLPINSENILEPFATYEFSDYKARYASNQLDFEGSGLGLGVDFQHKIGNITYLTLGIKYTMNTINAETHPKWENYLNKHDFISMKIGFTFAKYR